MSNGARRSLPAVGEHVHEKFPFIRIALFDDEMVPSVPRVRPSMPGVARVEDFFPQASRVQLEAALEVAKKQLEAKADDIYDDMLVAMFGTGLYLILSEDGSRFNIMGLGNPQEWRWKDASLLASATMRTKAAVEALTTPTAVAARIERNGVPSLRQATEQLLRKNE